MTLPRGSRGSCPVLRGAGAATPRPTHPYLPTLIHGLYFFLDLYIDVFSQKIVAAQVFAEENSDHASQLLKDHGLEDHFDRYLIALPSPEFGSTMHCSNCSVHQRCNSLIGPAL